MYEYEAWERWGISLLEAIHKVEKTGALEMSHTSPSEEGMLEAHASVLLGIMPGTYASGYGSVSSTPTEMSASERDRLLLEHLPTVRFVARRIHERLPQHVDLEDLVSAGIVGLMDAFSKFDHGKQVQFKSYAQFRIRGAILDSLRTLDWSPRELRRKGRAVEDSIRTLTQRLGRSPVETEVAQEMGISLPDYQQLLGELKGLEIGSLNLERNEDSGDDELSYLPGTVDDEPLFRCLKGELRQRLAEAIETLPEKERLVISLYYHEELTMKEIGVVLGVVESRVSQIHTSAVLKLRVVMSDLGAEKAANRNKVKRGSHGR